MEALATTRTRDSGGVFRLAADVATGARARYS